MIYVVYGHSGSGKTTLVSNLDVNGIIPKIPTVTTRPQRFLDEDDYEFISVADFMRMEAKGELLGIRNFPVETEKGTVIYNYGIPLKKLAPYANSTNNCVVVADALGVEELFDYFGSENTIAVYMYGSKELLKSRASNRKDFLEREWERRYQADNATLSVEEFDRNAAGDKLITGYRYYLVDIRLSPMKQMEYFKEVILAG